MAPKDGPSYLESEAACWDELTLKQEDRIPFHREDAKYLVTVAHQAFAIAEALGQIGRLEDARDALLRAKSQAGAVAPDPVGIAAIDLLRDVTAPVYSPYRTQRELLVKVVDPILRDLAKLGISRRLRARLSNPLIVAAAAVQMAVEDRALLNAKSKDRKRRGLRDVEPIEMEAIARLCGDREDDPFLPLDEEAKRKREAAWKRLLWRAQKLIPSFRKVNKEQDRT